MFLNLSEILPHFLFYMRVRAIKSFDNVVDAKSVLQHILKCNVTCDTHNCFELYFEIHIFCFTQKHLFRLT